MFDLDQLSKTSVQKHLPQIPGQHLPVVRKNPSSTFFPSGKKEQKPQLRVCRGGPTAPSTGQSKAGLFINIQA